MHLPVIAARTIHRARANWRRPHESRRAISSRCTQAVSVGKRRAEDLLRTPEGAGGAALALPTLPVDAAAPPVRRFAQTPWIGLLTRALVCPRRESQYKSAGSALTRHVTQPE
jgi:hypothetical protein